MCWSLVFAFAVPGSFAQAFFGFDRNEYPGDLKLPAFRREFSFAGYWLSNPPGTDHNSWLGKRALVREAGFGFLLLYNGRMARDLAGKDAAALGQADAADAVAAAHREGFPASATIFLDQEEGGRLNAVQSAYLSAWLAGVRASTYLPGVYCSGIPVAEGAGSITTAAQILSQAGVPPALWVVNDSYPASPGCVMPKKQFLVGLSGTPQAVVWQYARSPRTEFAGHGAAGYAADKQCYAPGLARGPQTFVDLNVSGSADPSRGR